MKRKINTTHLPFIALAFASFFSGTTATGQVQPRCSAINCDTTTEYDNDCIILPSTIIAAGSNWFFSTTDAEPAQWPNVDSLPGRPARAPFGLKPTEKIKTTLAARHTYYFTKTISFDPDLYNDFTFDISLSDGAIIYINGTATGRVNMPESDVNYNTVATSISKPEKSSHFIVSSSFFVKGNNTIQVEVHTAEAAEDDLFFDLELIGNRAYVPFCPLPKRSKPVCNCIGGHCGVTGELNREKNNQMRKMHHKAPGIQCCKSNTVID